MWKALLTGLGALGAVLLLLAPASAAVVPFGPQGPGDAAVYSVSFRGQFWQGDSSDYDGVLTLTREDQTHLDATWAGPETAMASGGPNGLGGIDTTSSIEWLDPYNVVAQLLYPVQGDLKLGITWTSQVPVHVNPGELIQVPVSATVLATERGHDLTVNFSGQRSGMFSYSGFVVPIDVSLKGSIAVVDGHIAGCTYSVQEAVHLGGAQAQNISWDWTLSPH
jgi:hypothetical protein